MPAIEDFVEQAAETQQRSEDDSEESSPLRANYRSDTDDEESHLRRPPTNTTSRSSFCDPTSPSSGAARSSGELSPSGSSLQRSGRKRRLPQAGGAAALSSSSYSSSSHRRAPRPPSYNETLLADKSFHNPHASETMADAFGIVRPASFVLDVGADDRPWGGAAGGCAAGKGATAEGGESDVTTGDGGEDQNWFYDTVRDRQNRLWANTRVRKGVELARKGQHQVRFFLARCTVSCWVICTRSRSVHFDTTRWYWSTCPLYARPFPRCPRRYGGCNGL